MSSGPPPVPGGRSPEEREAARREREARRAGGPPAAAGARPTPPPDAGAEPWLAEAQRLTRAGDPPAGGSSADGAVAGGSAATGGGSDGRGRAGSPPAAGGSRRVRWARIIVAGIAAFVLAGMAWFLVSIFQPFKGEAEGRAVRVSVPAGSSLGDIADLLEQNDVISDSGFFQLRARLEGRTGDLKPGSFELREDMSFAAALAALEEGVPPNITVVSLPEGLSRRELAPVVAQAGVPGNYRRASLRNPALDPRRYGARGATSLEGFLFPATYELRKGRPARTLVREQLEAFKREFAKVDLSYAKRRKLAAYDVLIIASLIEREAAVAKERRLISSVIYNRLKNDISLGIDATVRFIYGNWDEPLKQSELANPSPYNTRVNQGLPPGPIGNPGLASIRAAARPAETEYLFYVAAVCGEGKHRFAKTDAQFGRYVDEYNSARDERGKSPTEC